MDAGKLQQMKKTKTESAYTNSVLEHKMRKFKITQLLQKGEFLWAGKLLEKKFPGNIGRSKLPMCISRRAGFALWVLEIVLQDNESKEGLQRLASKEATRACVLSVAEREVSCGGSGHIGIVSGKAIGLQRFSVPAEPIECLRVLNEIWVGRKHCRGGCECGTLPQIGAIGKSEALHNLAAETNFTKK